MYNNYNYADHWTIGISFHPTFTRVNHTHRLGGEKLTNRLDENLYFEMFMSNTICFFATALNARRTKFVFGRTKFVL